MSKTTRDEAGGPAIDELLITASPYGMRAAAVAAGRPVAFFIEASGRSPAASATCTWRARSAG